MPDDARSSDDPRGSDDVRSTDDSGGPPGADADEGNGEPGGDQGNEGNAELGDDRADVDDDSSGLSLQLPPIQLPPFFPEDFRVLWPAGDGPRTRVSARAVALACAGFDVLDAALALTVDAPLVAGARTVGGALVAASAFGLFGVPYLWELVAALLGFGWVTAFPTLSALLVARSLR